MNYRIIDSHCHVQFPQYAPDRDTVIRRALDSGIGLVCVGTSIDSSREAIALAEHYDGLYASVGIHPSERGTLPEEFIQHPKVVAVGEIGLDYHHATMDDHERQKESFRAQLNAALLNNKPVIIHCRNGLTMPSMDAHDDMLSLLRGVSGRFIVHSFNGTREEAQRYMDIGCWFGLNAIVTFSKSYGEMVRMMPAERILLETDAPYLAPEPFRGKRNEPLYIEAVGNLIASIRGVKPEEFLYQTTENSRRIFGI